MLLFVCGFIVGFLFSYVLGWLLLLLPPPERDVAEPPSWSATSIPMSGTGTTKPDRRTFNVFKD
jgi:hypothetical protein